MDLVKKENWDLVNRACKRDRPKTQYDKKNKLKLIFTFLYDQIGIKRIMEYSAQEIYALYEWIDEKPISKKAKSRYRYHFKSIMDYILKINVDQPNFFEKNAYWNYILSRNYYEFKETGERRKITYISPEEMQQFLQHLMKTEINNYILFSILAYSGCRIGGLIELYIKNINFEKRTFITYEKPTKNSPGKNEYYLPGFFCDHLQTYLLRNQMGNDDKLTLLTTKAIRERLKQYKEWWPHLFRHSLRVNWQKKGMDRAIAEILLNHAPSTVDSIYLQSLNNDPKYLREQYNKFFPY